MPKAAARHGMLCVQSLSAGLATLPFAFNEEKNSAGNRAIRLLHELKAEHSKVSEEIRQRFAELSGIKAAACDDETLIEHRDLLTAQGGDLAQIKGEIKSRSKPSRTAKCAASRSRKPPSRSKPTLPRNFP